MRDLTDFSVYAESVHRLTDLGAVVTHVAAGTSQEGFDAEWRMLYCVTFDGGVMNRGEIFEEADLDTALARFDELDRPKPRLENAATRVIECFQTCFAARDWEAMTTILAEDISAEDHRPVMRAGTRPGREINIADWRSVAEVGFNKITSRVIAIRGERLALARFLILTGDEQPDPFHNDVLGLCEIDTDNRLIASTMFDIDHIDLAFAELDARYLAGEAAAHACPESLVRQQDSVLSQAGPDRRV